MAFLGHRRWSISVVLGVGRGHAEARGQELLWGLGPPKRWGPGIQGSGGTLNRRRGDRKVASEGCCTNWLT